MHNLVTSALGAGLIKCALNVVDGFQVNPGDVISYATKPAVVSTAAILGVLSFVGTLLCYLPAIVISFLTVFAMFYVVDKGLSGVEAIKASVSLVNCPVCSQVTKKCVLSLMTGPPNVAPY